MRYRYNKEKLQEIVSTSKSIAECLRKLNMKTAGGNYATLKKRFDEWDINTNHFTGKGWNEGLQFKPNKSKPLYKILVNGSKYQSHKLKLRLIKEGLKTHKCEKCFMVNWLNQPIPIELHHINGDKHDNRLENLQILCPNCHALTPNYRGKNKKLSAQKEISEVELLKFRETFIRNEYGNPEPSLTN